jgi:hypothetical protein
MGTRVTPEDHLGQVQASVAVAADPRLAENLRAALKHLHAFVEEVDMTRPSTSRARRRARSARRSWTATGVVRPSPSTGR